jgi:hypothetical protein
MGKCFYKYSTPLKGLVIIKYTVIRIGIITKHRYIDSTRRIICYVIRESSTWTIAVYTGLLDCDGSWKSTVIILKNAVIRINVAWIVSYVYCTWIINCFILYEVTFVRLSILWHLLNAYSTSILIYCYFTNIYIY